jgi:hypothetical protein
MKYTTDRKYRDFVEEEKVSPEKNKPILLNKKKSVFQKIINIFKGK